METALGHCAPVTCLALSSDSNFLVTGSRDTTILLWRIHRAFASHTGTIEPSSGAGTPGKSISSSTPANTLADKSRRRRIEGPIHVLRGHHREILCCCISSDLGVVVSCSDSSDVLLHSIRRGRLIRRLVGVDAHNVCLSSEGVIMTWNKLQHTLSSFTLNGVLVARAKLPLSGRIGCMEISVDGHSALIGMNSSSVNSVSYNNSQGLNSKQTGTEYFYSASDQSVDNNILDVPLPSICFLDLHTLKVWKTEVTTFWAFTKFKLLGLVSFMISLFHVLHFVE